MLCDIQQKKNKLLVLTGSLSAVSSRSIFGALYNEPDLDQSRGSAIIRCIHHRNWSSTVSAKWKIPDVRAFTAWFYT